MAESLVGRGRDAIDMIVDGGSFKENLIGSYAFDPELGPGAVVGTGAINGREATILANDAQAYNDRFPVVYLGVIGLEEAFKMAAAVYRTIAADAESEQKRPIVLIVDTPGNAPGKVEEIVGMNNATGGYQLALAEARKAGHPIVTMIVGRAISGGFLCHGLQADRILALSSEFDTMVHVMPLTSIARITKLDLGFLESLAQTNPVFAAGVEFFYRLGGINEILHSLDEMPSAIDRHITEIIAEKRTGDVSRLGPAGRAVLGEERGGRIARGKVIARMESDFAAVADKYVL